MSNICWKKGKKIESNMIYNLNLNNNTIKLFEVLNSKKITWKIKIKNKLLYKKIFCKNKFTKNNCVENKCNNVHHVNELTGNYLFSIDNFNILYKFYKTQYCPFIKFQHDYKYCIYSHGYLDYRRPYNNYLIPKKCSNFLLFLKKFKENKNIEINKLNICKNYDKCLYLHSFHEYQWHKSIILRHNYNNKIIGKIIKNNIKKFEFFKIHKFFI